MIRSTWSGAIQTLFCSPHVEDYRPDYLEELLYQDRRLLDGYDKVQSIYDAGDWSCFSRFRASMRQKHGSPNNPPMEIAPWFWKPSASKAHCPQLI